MSEEARVAWQADTEVTCATCGQWGIVRAMDTDGWLIEHRGRRFWCRVPR